MSEERSYFAAAYHPTMGFLVTGGMGGGVPWDRRSSTEITKEGLTHSCLTKLLLEGAILK